MTSARLPRPPVAGSPGSRPGSVALLRPGSVALLRPGSVALLRPGSVAVLRLGRVARLTPGAAPGFSTSLFFRFPASFLAATCQPFVKRHASASLPSRRGLRKPDDLQRDGFRRLALGVELRVRLEVERLAVLQHLPHPRHGILSC